MDALSTSLLTQKELVDAAGQILPVVNQILAREPLMLSVSAAAAADVDALNQADMRDPGNPLTKPVKEADDHRDNAFTTLRNFVAAWANNRGATESQRQAGQRLASVISKHGNSIHRLGYGPETGALKSLFAELATPACAADLALLGLTPLLQTLVAAQDAFAKIWDGRSDAPVDGPLPVKANHLPHLKRRLNLLLSAIDEMIYLQPAAETEPNVVKLREIITALMKPVHARQTREANEAAQKPA